MFLNEVGADRQHHRVGTAGPTRKNPLRSGIDSFCSLVRVPKWKEGQGDDRDRNGCS
jgi:hypothetical protein